MRLDLVVGPNGAGKSTFVELVLAPLRPRVTVVNADVIAAARWPDDPSGHAYDAAAVAAATREALIAARVPFIAETVFSHPSKLDLVSDAQAAGYTVTLHVLLVPEHLSVQRVAHRVGAGGHDVPEEKIRSRYARVWPLVAEAITRADLAHIFDNSQIDGPDELAMFAGGVPLGPCRWPDWAPASLADRWPR
ncbi:MAG TPA: AAA family ATPase [Acidimicrobiales bacterium]|nr:AAA family ATPase [Acidimicrobiales bacterium]